MLLYRQSTSANEAEIGRIFLVLKPPNSLSALAHVGFQGYAAEVFFFDNARPESFVTRSKDRAKNTIARV